MAMVTAGLIMFLSIYAPLPALRRMQVVIKKNLKYRQTN
jgi:hypothetical protein